MSLERDQTGRLAGRVAIITGAASGIGEASAALFAEHRSCVVVADRDRDKGLEVVNDIVANGGDALFVEADLTNEDQCRSVVTAALDWKGRIDILLNNAGTIVNKLVHETSNDEFDTVMNVNLRSVFWMCKYSIPHMLEAGGGVICSVASKTGLVAQHDSPIYCASKGAVVLLMKAIALDYARQGIRANAICPGIIDTPLLDESIERAPDPAAFRKWNEEAQPIGRLGTPRECAYAALYLCSDESSFINGVALPVDGGFTAM